MGNMVKAPAQAWFFERIKDRANYALKIGLKRRLSFRSLVSKKNHHLTKTFGSPSSDPLNMAWSPLN